KANPAEFSFALLSLALSLHKIGCARQSKSKSCGVFFCSALTCTIFTHRACRGSWQVAEKTAMGTKPFPRPAVQPIEHSMRCPMAAMKTDTHKKEQQ
ncbi:MAG: hypothetical protein PUB53_00005, partial [Bacteroidales bacterium]|nr:hypothetical protein [Bacteroidales bacterium]